MVIFVQQIFERRSANSGKNLLVTILREILMTKIKAQKKGRVKCPYFPSFVPSTPLSATILFEITRTLFLYGANNFRKKAAANKCETRGRNCYDLYDS